MAWPVRWKILLNDRKVILSYFSVLFCLTIAPRQNWSSDVTLNMQVLLKNVATQYACGFFVNILATNTTNDLKSQVT